MTEATPLQQKKQRPLHYAFVSPSDPLELPLSSSLDQQHHGGSTTPTPTTQESLVQLYQSYAERYPNPRLIEEYQDRDQLLQATSAAHSANPHSLRRPKKQQKKSGWFGSWFGGGGDDEELQQQSPLSERNNIPEDDEEDQWLEYTEVHDIDDNNNTPTLCGTHQSLDRSCIPPEAHSMARLSLVSSRNCRERPLVVRASPHLPCDATFVIVDVGIIAELSANSESDNNNIESSTTTTTTTYSKTSSTADRDDLRQYASSRSGGFDLGRVRAASFGPNFMVISWGFSDGIVVFYRRIHMTTNNEIIGWEPVVFLGPSQAVLEHSYDAYVDDEEDEDANSALLRITDIVPLVVTTPGVPAAALAVSRLGGYMEVLPIPPPLWYGPIFSPDKHKPRKKRPKKRQHHKSVLHYAKPYLVDVSSDKAPIPILALTTMEYQMDILCLEAIRTRVTMDTEWDRDRYDNAPPPAEYILVACGTQRGHEVLTFWSVSYLFAEEPPTDGSAGFSLHAVLQEALDVGPVGADLSIFANRAILNQWRQPRKVSLKEQQPPPAPVALSEEGEGGNNDQEGGVAAQHPENDKIVDDQTKPLSVYDRVTTISVSAPIVTMQSITVPFQQEQEGEDGGSASQMVLLSLLDWNGSVMVMDCSFLERMVSHSLSEEEYQAVRNADMATEHDGQEPPPVPELVKTLVERSRMMEWMKSTSPKRHVIYQCTNIQWLARADNAADPWLILMTSPWQRSPSQNNKSGRIMILSGFLGSQSNLEHPSIQTVAFPTDRATLQGNTTVPLMFAEDDNRTAESSSSLLRIVFPPKKQHVNQLCICLLQPLESQDIITSLAQDGKYKQALAAAQELNTEEQQLVMNTLEECRQHLWEQSGDLSWLKQVTDDAYVVRQALSLFESLAANNSDKGLTSHSTNSPYLEYLDVDTCRDICSLALQRVSKLRLGSALTLGYGTEDARAKLQGMLVRLGTYELLCHSLNAELSFPRFRQLFVNASVVHLAKSFAPLSDLPALSILWFRHTKELQPHMIDILTQLPMTLDPLSFCHLLPIAPKPQGADNSSLFLTGLESSAGNKLLHISQLPTHLKETFEIKVILDGNDEKIVLDHSSGTAGSPSDDLSNGNLLSFYVSRANEMQRFSGNLQHVADFCALALLAGRTSVEQLEAASSEGTLPVTDTDLYDLYRTWGCAVALQKMLVESAADAPMEGEEGGLHDLEPFVTVTPLDLSSMELVEIVKMVLGGQDDAEIIFDTYKDYLLPLLKFIPSEQKSDLDEAISSYCIDVVRSSIFHPVEAHENKHSSDNDMVVDDTEDGTLKALQICRAIAYGSRTTIRKSERIVQEKKVLIKLVLKAIFEVSLRCEIAAMPKNVCQTFVNLMWDMYESMPDGGAEGADWDEEYTELMAKANLLYNDLVGVVILSQWPDCHAQAFSFLTRRTRSREDPEETSDNATQRLVVGQEALASLCRSFCSQAASRKGAIGLSGLLRCLTSDIEQLYQICYDKEEAFQPMLVETLSAELISHLFRQREFELVAQLLSEADESWWDKEQEARAVGSYVDEIVFSDDAGLSASAPTAGENPLESAIACQDVLGQVFPELQTGFQSVRRYLDAAHFINTAIFSELQMPKPIKPNDLRGDLPLDVVESILKALPKAIIIGCKEWGEASLAVHANKALREFHEKMTHMPEEAEPKNLPPIPGGAVFHLAGILGLEDTASVLVVKTRVVHHGVSSGLFGASAAVCRTILYDDNAFSSPEDSVVRLGAVAEVVVQDGFDDLLTKRELCVAALQKHQWDMSVENCKPFNDILKVFTSLEPKTSQAQNNESQQQNLNLPPPSDSMGCLYKDTWGQYSVNIYELFSTLQQHTSTCVIDDSLLNALSRYVFFSCIFRSTRPRSELPGKLEKATSNHLLILGASLLLHIKGTTSISIPALKELRQILEKQAMAIINQHPTAFEDFVKVPNENIVRELVGRGFTPMAARRSALATRNAGTQQALQWGVTNARDPRMNDPIIFVASKRNVSVDKMSIQQIMNTFAFSAQFLSGAKTIEEWLLEHPITVDSKLIAPPTVKDKDSKISKTSGINGGSASGSTSAKLQMPTQKQPSAPPQMNPTMPASSQTTPIPKSIPAMSSTGWQAKSSAPDQSSAAAKPPSPHPQAKVESSAPPISVPPVGGNSITAPVAAAAAKPPPPHSPARASAPASPAPPAPPASGASNPAPYLTAAAAKPPPPPPAKPTEAGFSSQGAFQSKVTHSANRSMPQPSASSTVIPGKDTPVYPDASRLRSVQQQKDAIGAHFSAQGQASANQKPAISASLPTANKFTTPTNRPTSLQLGRSTGSSSTSSDYDTLKNRGKTALESMRASPRNQAETREERKRLIEAGRRLLAKSRSSNTATPKDSTSTGAAKPGFGARPVNPLTGTSIQQASRPGTIATTDMSTPPPKSAPETPSAQPPAKPAAGFGIAMGSPGDSKPEAGWGFDEDDGLGDVESAVDGSDGWGFDEEPDSNANETPAQAPSPTAPLPTPQAEKLEINDDDGWDFEDF